MHLHDMHIGTALVQHCISAKMRHVTIQNGLFNATIDCSKQRITRDRRADDDQAALQFCQTASNYQYKGCRGCNTHTLRNKFKRY